MILRAAFISGVVLSLICLAPSAGAAAQDSGANVREAAKHFQRGVTLYGETDYRGALVEFQRAYALAPRAAVLYNVGETEYQLRDYAGALATFERFVAESSPDDDHRPEVEASVKELRSRVGELTISTVPAGADITVDDRRIGKTPLGKPVIVSVGHVKVSASMLGRLSAVQYVDVAAEDHVSVALQLGEPAEEGTAAKPAAGTAAEIAARTAANPAAPPAARAPTAVTAAPAAPLPPGRSPLRTAGWIVAGLAAGGAVTFGLLARNESSDLQAERNMFPTTSGKLDHLASVTTTYSVIADSLAATAVVVGAIMLLSGGGAQTDAGAIQVGLGPGSASAQIGVRF